MRLFTKNAFIKSMGGDPEKESDIPYLQSCSPFELRGPHSKTLIIGAWEE